MEGGVADAWAEADLSLPFLPAEILEVYKVLSQQQFQVGCSTFIAVAVNTVGMNLWCSDSPESKLCVLSRTKCECIRRAFQVGVILCMDKLLSWMNADVSGWLSACPLYADGPSPLSVTWRKSYSQSGLKAPLILWPLPPLHIYCQHRYPCPKQRLERQALGDEPICHSNVFSMDTHPHISTCTFSEIQIGKVFNLQRARECLMSKCCVYRNIVGSHQDSPNWLLKKLLAVMNEPFIINVSTGAQWIVT